MFGFGRDFPHFLGPTSGPKRHRKRIRTASPYPVIGIENPSLASQAPQLPVILPQSPSAKSVRHPVRRTSSVGFATNPHPCVTRGGRLNGGYAFDSFAQSRQYRGQPFDRTQVVEVGQTTARHGQAQGQRLLTGAAEQCLRGFGAGRRRSQCGGRYPGAREGERPKC